MKKIKIAVLISGRGSNLGAIIEASKDTSFPAEIALVISNKKDAGGLILAQENQIPTVFIDHKLFDNRAQFDQELTKVISDSGCELVCLAGFMRILSADFIRNWNNKIINIHPSLLPSFKGGNAVEDALNYGVKISGCTVHYVIEEVDSGEIIDQIAVEILENDTKESLAARILEKEHILYPRALKKVCEKIQTKIS